MIARFSGTLFNKIKILILQELFLGLVIIVEPKRFLLNMNEKFFLLINQMFYFSDTLPIKSPILIIMYHLEHTPESYKLLNRTRGEAFLLVLF